MLVDVAREADRQKQIHVEVVTIYVPLASKQPATIAFLQDWCLKMSGQLDAQPNRHALIAEIVRRFEQADLRLGKTALQKIIFLLQRSSGVDAGYNYTLYTYGPFCADVARDLDVVAAFGGVQISHDLGCGGYAIHPGPANDEIRECAAAFLGGLSNALERVVQDFGGLTAKDLELRSTIVYLAKPGMLRKELIEQVHDVKPHFAPPAIAAAVGELEMQGYIDGLLEDARN